MSFNRGSIVPGLRGAARFAALVVVVVGVLGPGPVSAAAPGFSGLSVLGAVPSPWPGSGPLRIGVLSDTHGIVGDRVLDLLAGVDLILHAGDVGDQGVLDRLATVAPVVAVGGNSDLGPLGARLRRGETVETPAGRIYLTHILPVGPVPGDLRLVVFGHTHVPVFRDDGGAALLNPGSASEGRGAPASVAVLTLEAGAPPRAEFFSVETGGLAPAAR